MPFHRYNPAAAKKLFGSSTNSSKLPPHSPSRIEKSTSTNNTDSPLATKLKENLERARAKYEKSNKEKLDADLERSRQTEKEAYRARLEQAQNDALNEQLKLDALNALREKERPGIIEELRLRLEPEIRKEVEVKLRVELKAKVITDLKSELNKELTDKVWQELKVNLHDEAKNELMDELQEELEPQIRLQLEQNLYSEVIEQIKDEHRDRILLQLKNELAEQAAKEVNGHYEHDPELQAESEASDIEHPAAELATNAKRRHSETFEQENAEVRSKKLRASAPPNNPVFQPVNHLKNQLEHDVRPVDESLDDGVNADVDEDMQDQAVADLSGQGLEEVDQVIIPQDVYADADNELSEQDMQPTEDYIPLEAAAEEERIDADANMLPAVVADESIEIQVTELATSSFDGFENNVAGIPEDITANTETLQHALNVEQFLTAPENPLALDPTLMEEDGEELCTNKPLPSPYPQAGSATSPESSSLSDPGVSGSSQYSIEPVHHQFHNPYPTGERDGEENEEEDDEEAAYDADEQEEDEIEEEECGEQDLDPGMQYNAGEENEYDDDDEEEDGDPEQGQYGYEAESGQGDEDDEEEGVHYEEGEEADHEEDELPQPSQPVNLNSKYSQLGAEDAPIDLDSD